VKPLSWSAGIALPGIGWLHRVGGPPPGAEGAGLGSPREVSRGDHPGQFAVGVISKLMPSFT